MNEWHQDKRFRGAPDTLRSAERLERLEVDKVVALCLQGIDAKDVLDIGTGSGVFAEAFAKRLLNVSAIDVSEAMIEYAQEIVPGVDFKIANMEDLPYPPGSFDVLFFGISLHESQDILKTLKEAWRVARLRVAVLEWQYREEEVGPPLEHRIPQAELTRMAKQAGFAKVDFTPLKVLALYCLEKQ